MSPKIILASGSQIRQELLRNAGVLFVAQSPRVDEDAVKSALLAEAVAPRDIADALAELKAQKISAKHPEDLVIGCDQVLEFQGALYSKAETKTDLIDQLSQMRGQTHRLFSAAVIFQHGEPVWRYIGKVELTMRPFSDSYIKEYVEENWDMVKSSVGGYHIETNGVRLFSSIQGDYFSVLGIPLIELLNYLSVKGVLRQ